MPTSGVRLGSLTLQPRRQLLGTDGPLPIGRRALDILSALAEADGGLVTKDELLAAVWPGIIVEENAIQVHVAALRKVLGAEADRLVTVRGLGYRLDLSRSDLRPGRAAPEPNRSGAAVAVLPFANLTGDPDKDYLGDGIAEEIITTLSQARGLKVPARTSTFAYKGHDVDVRRIAADLGVDAVLEGSVRVSDKRVRVAAQLIDAASGFHIWAQNYDRALRDLFELQDEIARNIAGALKATLGLGERRPADPEAYDLYLQASALAARSTSGDLPGAIKLCEEAIARDPAFAAAWARQAAALLLASNTGVLPFTARGEARAKAEQAIRLDPCAALPHAVLGGLAGLSGRWLDAEAAFDAALALDPSDGAIHRTKAYYVDAPCGRLAAADGLVRRGYELAPAEPLHSLGCATIAGLRGDEASVFEHLQSAVRLGLSADERAIRAILAEAALRMGRWEEAAAHITVALPPPLLASGGGEVAALVYRACAGAGDKAAASAAVNRLTQANDADDRLWRYQIAAGTLMNWQMKLGALDAAFAVADRFVKAWERSGQLATMGLFQIWLPEMRPFRADPRFAQFAERLGMFAYWAEHGPPDGHSVSGKRLTCD